MQFNDALVDAIKSLDETSADYHVQYNKALNHVQTLFHDRAYKMLVIANPTNREEFHRLLYSYDWSRKSGVLSKEKLYILSYSKLSPTRYC